MKLSESQLRGLVKGIIAETYYGRLAPRPPQRIPGQDLEGFYLRVGLTGDEISQMPKFLSGERDFYGTPQFDKLYEYLAFKTGEMPYGTAKARTGDPDYWILDYIEENYYNETQ